MATQNFNILRGKNPVLILKEITDTYVRKNFEALKSYFEKQNQLLDFKFFEVEFTGAESNRQLTHGLGYKPEDVIVTKVVGAGTVSFNHGLFTDQTIDMTASGPCIIRFFVGSYWNFQTDKTPKSTDKSTYGLESLTSLVPSGSILPFGGTVAPLGYLLCNGAEYSRADYPTLFAAIGSAFGSTGGEKFNVPDFRGRFMRGVDNGIGRDPDRASRAVSNPGSNTGDLVGSYQADALQTITGYFQASAFEGGVSKIARDGAFNANSLNWNSTFAGGGGGVNTGTRYAFDSSAVTRGSTETRPKNVGVNYIIKT